MEKLQIIIEIIKEVCTRTTVTIEDNAVKFKDGFTINELYDICEIYLERAEADRSNESSGLHKHDVSNNEVAVCPKCASEDVIWTCYCNCCHECM